MAHWLLEEIKQCLLPFLNDQGVELVEMNITRERGRSCVKLLVDKPGGITLDECARLNQKIGQILDEKDMIQESYLLEVSSPGLDRPLKTAKDFQRVQGKLVRIVLHQPVQNQNVWVGILDSVDEEKVTIQPQGRQKLYIPRNDIAKACLEVRI